MGDIVRGVLICAAVVFSVVIVGPAYGAFTGLIEIPTADTLGADQYMIEPQISGRMPAGTADIAILNSQFGFGERFEAGTDLYYARNTYPRVFFNWKYRFAVDTRRTLAVAAGVYNTEPDEESIHYIAATKDLAILRLTLGAAEINDEARWFAGIDRTFKDRLTLMADYTSGWDNFWSVGSMYQLTGPLALQSGFVFPNSPGDSFFTVLLMIGGRYR